MAGSLMKADGQITGRRPALVARVLQNLLYLLGLMIKR